MPVTLKNVKDALMPDEPDYGAAAKRLGQAALPHLRRLIKGSDEMLAAKAASLAGMFRGEDAADVLELAASHADLSVRCAAAHRLPGIGAKHSEPILLKLLSDRNASVAHRAAVAATGVALPAVQEKLKKMSASKKPDFVRAAASRSLRKVSADLRSIARTSKKKAKRKTTKKKGVKRKAKRASKK